MLAATFWEEPFAGPFGNWWCLSCWCLGGLSLCFGGRSVMVWVFCSCFGGVSAVSRHCSGAVLGVLKEWHLLD